MFCTRKRNRVIHQSLSFSGEIIKDVTSHKYLGLNLTSSCDWLMHIDFFEPLKGRVMVWPFFWPTMDFG